MSPGSAFPHPTPSPHPRRHGCWVSIKHLPTELPPDPTQVVVLCSDEDSIAYLCPLSPIPKCNNHHNFWKVPQSLVLRVPVSFSESIIACWGGGACHTEQDGAVLRFHRRLSALAPLNCELKAWRLKMEMFPWLHPNVAFTHSSMPCEHTHSPDWHPSSTQRSA